MVSINYSSREVCCKIVYYGPGLSGKTTNLQYVHSKVPTSTRGKLISLATEADRTLYFDFLPINIGTINGFAAKFQLYTVPGQVYYNATRKLVLRGVDGVVFVADSQPGKMDENIESLMNLEENLREYGYMLDDLPMVIQYNKRDLPGVMPAEILNAQLNQRGRPWFEASATIGNGVFDTLKMIIKLVLEKAKSAGGARSRPVAAAQTVAATAPAMAAVSPLASSSRPAPDLAASASTPRPPAPDTPAAPEGPEVGRDDSSRFRPFPGSEEKPGDARIPRTSYAARRRDRRGRVAGELETVQTREVVDDSEPPSKLTPSMAPALRRRGQTRKRGFFKRLFGIK